MSGSAIGGHKAAATIKARYGKDFFAEIGARGGKIGRTGGLYNDPERARHLGSIGGRRSRRGLKLIKNTSKHLIYIDRSTGKEVKYLLDGTLDKH